LPYFAVSESTAWPAVEAPGGGSAAGALVIEGWARPGWVNVGWVSVGGRLGPAPGPEGGARFMAGPAGVASGTEAGGTGGGRSENSWADAGTGENDSQAASQSVAPGPAARPVPATPLPHQIMAMLFTENAANSSLRDPGYLRLGEPLVSPNLNEYVALPS
jgi:hypothetical protein